MCAKCNYSTGAAAAITYAAVAAATAIAATESAAQHAERCASRPLVVPRTRRPKAAALGGVESVVGSSSLVQSPLVSFPTPSCALPPSSLLFDLLKTGTGSGTSSKSHGHSYDHEVIATATAAAAAAVASLSAQPS